MQDGDIIVRYSVFMFVDYLNDSSLQHLGESCKEYKAVVAKVAIKMMK